MDKLYLYGVIALLLAVIILQIFLRGNKWRGTTDEKLTAYKSRYGAKVYQKRFLLTKPEYSFWTVLKDKCALYDLQICPKVRIEDFVTVSCRNEKKRLRYRGYIKSRHVDFLLCDDKLNIIAGIELDDKSHGRGNVKKVDTLKDDVFEAIGVPLYRIKTNGNYAAQVETVLHNLGYWADQKGTKEKCE